MTKFDLLAAVLADLDAAVSEPVEPVLAPRLAPLKALQSLEFSRKASGASQNHHFPFGYADKEKLVDAKNLAEGRTWGSINLTGSTGSAGTTVYPCGFQRGQSKSSSGSAGSFNKELLSPKEWLEAAETLLTMRIPHRVPTKDWDSVKFAVQTFSTSWAGQAAALNWTTLEIFGCRVGAGPMEYSGGLIVEMAKHNGDLVALTAEEAVLRHRGGSGYSYIHKSSRPANMIPLWSI